MPSPGPMFVIEWTAALLALGLAAALVAAARGERFTPWCLFGLVLPVVALPSALLLPRRRAVAPAPRAHPLHEGAGRIEALTACRPLTLWTVALLLALDAVLVDFHRPLFGRVWQYVMWEGGVLELLTTLNFLVGAVAFALAAGASADPVRRGWLAVFAGLEVVLAGEEIHWFKGQVVLDLNDPDLARRYNPDHAALHSGMPGWVPMLGFFIVVLFLRLFHRIILPRLRLPVAVGFLNAVLLTAVAVLLMRFDQDRYLLVDEVYEWSSSVLLLYLGLFSRWGWFFRR